MLFDRWWWIYYSFQIVNVINDVIVWKVYNCLPVLYLCYFLAPASFSLFVWYLPQGVLNGVKSVKTSINDQQTLHQPISNTLTPSPALFHLPEGFLFTAPVKFTQTGFFVYKSHKLLVTSQTYPPKIFFLCLLCLTVTPFCPSPLDNWHLFQTPVRIVCLPVCHWLIKITAKEM
mgnify:CR=1 FL=1